MIFLMCPTFHDVHLSVKNYYKVLFFHLFYMRLGFKIIKALVQHQRFEMAATKSNFAKDLWVLTSIDLVRFDQTQQTLCVRCM